MRVRNKTALQTQMGLAPGVDRPAVRRRLAPFGSKGSRPAVAGSAWGHRQGRPARAARLGRADVGGGLRRGRRARRQSSVGCVLGYDEKLAHLIQAGADFIVVPSRFEPCGLTQLCALRYGAPPIVARVGGLADTVIDANEAATAAGVATGFQFHPPSVEALTYALDRALAIGRDPAVLRRLRLNGMRSDVSWRGPAKRYAALYRDARRACRMSERKAARGVAGHRARPRGGARRCPTPRARRSASTTAIARLFARRWRATPTASCAASRPASAPARATASASKGLMIRSGETASTPSKLLADPYAWRFDRPFRLHPSMFAFGEDTRPACAEGDRGRAAGGRAGPQAHRARGAHHLRAQPARLLAAEPGDPRSARAELSPASRIPPRSRIWPSSASPRSRSCPPTRSSTSGNCPPLGLSNAWGYNAVVFGAPDPRLAPGGWAEVRAATDALHAAGMEAILDVVFNHNGESDQFGPTLSFRGLDNAAWFRLDPRDPELYINDAGTGNCLALDRPLVIDMAIGALRRWMVHGGVDGFRFDLATALGRARTASTRMRRSSRRSPPIRCSPRRASSPSPGTSAPAAIASASSVPPSPNGTTVFATPRAASGAAIRACAARSRPGWRVRATFSRAPPRRPRASISSSPTTASRFATSSPTSASTTRPTARTIATARTTTTRWNHGVEGPSDDPAIVEARSRDERNLLALFSPRAGRRCLAMGSELGFSQGGNNNAYAQDNATSAIDWRGADASLIAFTRRLIAVRRANAALSRDAFLTGPPFDASRLPDVEWRDANGPMTQSGWNDPPAPFWSPSSPRRKASGVDRVAVAMNRSDADAELRLPAPRAGMAWRALARHARARRARALARARRPLSGFGRARRSFSPRRCAAAASAPARRPPRRSTRSRARRGSPPNGGTSAASARSFRRKPRSRFWTALGLEVASEAQARDSLTRLVDETRRRRLPFSLVLRDGEPLAAPLRDTPEAAMRGSTARTAPSPNGRSRPPTASGASCPTDAPSPSATIALPTLPIGRHRLIVDGVECALTVAPPKAYGPEAARRASGSASRRSSTPCVARADGRDQGIGDFSALRASRARRPARAGAAYLGVSPLHMLFPGDRERASPYYPSDRRFLDPICIDVARRRGPAARRGAERRARGAGARSSPRPRRPLCRVRGGLARPSARRSRRAAPPSPASARRGPSDPLVADYHAFARRGGETLRRFAAFQAAADGEAGENWRLWPQDLRDGEPKAIDAAIERNRQGFEFALFCQWLADRQLARAADARARAAASRSASTAISRSAPRRTAPKPGRMRGALARGVTVGAPPDPFSVQGQNWSLPAPNPLAGAREGWASLSAVYRANMRHAGMLRIDHAMGLQRLFLIPEGARPAEGAYLAYPLDDLIGHIALESERAQCMVVGEDLGTVPEGFRDRLTRANITGMRVLWFERKGVGFAPPAAYPPTVGRLRRDA